MLVQMDLGKPWYPRGALLAPWARVQRSASSLISRVLTPGLTISARWSNSLAANRPARRIFSISRGESKVMVSLPMNYPTVEKDSCYISYPSKIGQRYCLGGWVMGVGSGEMGVGCGV